jgi:hypothetical protein
MRVSIGITEYYSNFRSLLCRVSSVSKLTETDDAKLVPHLPVRVSGSDAAPHTGRNKCKEMAEALGVYAVSRGRVAYSRSSSR